MIRQMNVQLECRTSGYDDVSAADGLFFPKAWRFVLIALCTLILCSCQASRYRGQHLLTGRANDSLPWEAYAGSTGGAVMVQQPAGYDMADGVPLPYMPQGPWAPPGISKPWPADEYLRDGGDRKLPAAVGSHGRIGGVEMEDSVACFDTLDGRTVVEPTNEVFIYSPRFGAVRQVVDVSAYRERQKAGSVALPEKLETPTVAQKVERVKQNVQLAGESSARPAVALRTEQRKDIMSTALLPNAFQDRFKPYENLSIIRRGIMEMSDKAQLAAGSAAAIAWSHTQVVQVIIDKQNAMAEVKYDAGQSVYTVSSPPGKPRLRIYKVASTPFAKPGETVDFTIRFDNIGNQTIGNVTIIDSLSTRLEYELKSAQCSVGAKFYILPNEGGSNVIRCELTDPLEPGQGGILRFRCRVR